MGCDATKALEEKIYRAVMELNLDACVGRVDNVNTFLEYDLEKTPALMINEEVVLNSEVLNLPQILELLKTKSIR